MPSKDQIQGFTQYKNIKTKKCIGCKNTLPATFQYFFKNKSSLAKSKLSSRCKDCLRALRINNKERNKNQVFDLKETKKCPQCKEKKPATPEFFYRNSSLKTGLDSWCKDCKKIWDKFNHKLKTYKISRKQYFKMLEVQRNKCDICGRDFNEKFTPRIDHNHKTGALRALLCNNCNLVVGNSLENSLILIKTVHFLKKFKK